MAKVRGGDGDDNNEQVDGKETNFRPERGDDPFLWMDDEPGNGRLLYVPTPWYVRPRARRSDDAVADSRRDQRP